MKPKDAIKSYYGSNFKKNAKDYQILGWESEEAQRIRFKVLTDNIDLNGKSLLDVGCGLGNLAGFLIENNVSAAYTGADILESMAKAAKERNPEAEFLFLDIFDAGTLADRKFDVVFTSGIFNLNLKNNIKFLEKAIIRFIELANSQVVFNMLHERSENKEPSYYYYNPEAVAELIESIAAKPLNVKFIDNYLHNDFTVIMDLYQN
ncbi:MAG: methyltransferase domain-containing protein [Eubacteriales bacterium]|nr:methyltransferase domain-containing protein [Eubacteriales bacterium]